MALVEGGEGMGDGREEENRDDWKKSLTAI